MSRAKPSHTVSSHAVTSHAVTSHAGWSHGTSRAMNRAASRGVPSPAMNRGASRNRARSRVVIHRGKRRSRAPSLRCSVASRKRSD